MSSLTPKHAGPREFIWLIASIMMIVAFAIDSMLPALPQIGRSLGVSVENQRQFVISAFLIGFGIAQIFIGTFSDRYGRRGIMLWSLIAYAVTSLMAALAPTFELLLLARVAQGVAAAGARVMVTAAVRDRFEGREMARVMSFAHVIFMAAPILAPAMGQLVLEIAKWQWIFGVLALIGVLIWFWVLLRLPETLEPNKRVEISIHQLKTSWMMVLRDRQSSGYTIAGTAMMAALMGFLLSVQQVFENVLNRGDLLPIGFAIMAAGMAAASLVNGAIVMRYGMRLIGHAALMGFTVIAIIHAIVAVTGHETLYTFIGLQMMMMMCFSFAAGNFGAMALENLGSVAGTASSIQGSFNSIFGTVLGTVIGQMFNGTTVPLYTGFAIFGMVALAVVFVTEQGSFFVARHAPKPFED